jgi:CheY-like chemotaxis protein
MNRRRGATGASPPSFASEKSVATRTAPGIHLCDHPSVASILIVDDDQRFRGIARKLLESEGFHVVGEADDGEAALAAVRELEPDVVLLDVHLPDIDGFEVAERLATKGGPAVVLTSTRDELDFGLQVSRSGARGFVPKGEISAERIASLCG